MASGKDQVAPRQFAPAHTRKKGVAVGTVIADRPPRRSVRALLTHTEESVPGRCEKIAKPCHSERSEESAFVCFQRDKCRCFASLSMTDDFFTPSRRPFVLTYVLRYPRPAGLWGARALTFEPLNLDRVLE